MSEKSERLRQKRQGYRLHQARLRGEKKGVSPIVATLILILIAVAAAAFLYLWLVVWQGNITGGIGQPKAQSTLQIGGSTSVYPFSSTAATWFEQNNSDVVISDNQGGTGAGMLAVCAGQVDIGTASTPETASGLISADNCPSSDLGTIQITTVAYDAVDVVVQGANPHGLLSINYDTLDVIYQQGSSSAGSIAVSGTSTIDGQTITAIGLTIPAQGTEFAWDQLPALVQGASLVSAGVTYTEALSSGTGAGTPVTVGSDIVCAGAATGGVWACTAGAAGDTPCGFVVCNSGAAAVVPISRSDASGTTQTFEAKLLGYTASNKISASFSGLGYSGCGSNNLLSDCGFTYAASQEGNGNPGVLSLVAGSANAIGYASDGLARTYTGVGTAGIIPFDAVGQAGALPQTSGTNIAYGAVVPTTGATGTIAAGITDSSSVNQYSGWRPFEFVSLQPYTGVAQEFVTFIMDPANNQALATATGEVSVYTI